MSQAPAPAASGVARLFAPLVGLVALGILLQGVIAGVFLQTDGKRDSYETWISVHGIIADVAVVLALLAVIVAVAGLRGRRDLVIGSIALFVLLVVETVLGQLINGSIGGSDHDALTAVHIPLALALIALAAWLSARVAQWRRAGSVTA